MLTLWRDQLCNYKILKNFPGQERVYISADQVVLEEADAPVDFLQSLHASGLSISKLILKEGCPLMLLQNLDLTNGICNEIQFITTPSRESFIKV